MKKEPMFGRRLKMRGSVGAVVIAMAAMIIVGPVLSQELGSVKQGQALAETVCAECHAVKRGAVRSPFDHAPTFETIAQTPGMTPLALRVWFRSAHREMPNIMLQPEEVDNVIAYLQTLKTGS
jgi:mono/diheme cytochrome c family protein